MKATIDVPDEPCRKVKAKSALLGKPIREERVELYQRWLAGALPEGPGRAPETWLRRWLDDADAAVRGAPAGRTAREELAASHDRLDRP